MIGRIALAFAISAATATTADAASILDVDARRAWLASPAGAETRAACLAPELDDDLDLAPVAGLGTTPGYGSDQGSADFAWATMVLAGKSLAGDAEAETRLIALLRHWAEADALVATEDVHDAHFALKRTLLPTIVAYSIVRDRMAAERRAEIDAWLDTLVAKIDRTFDGDVDLNNHRYLADSVLAAWGAVTNRQELLAKARGRLDTALLQQMRADGSFPLESRRGSRAIWYHRQSLAGLTVIVLALQQSGADPFQSTAIADAWERTTAFFLDSLRTPRVVLRYAVENHIPGPSQDYNRQDLGFLDRRGHDRHYMAWAEAAAGFLPDAFVTVRFKRMLEREAGDERPLIDEFSGGAGTCFWRVPGSQQRTEG